MDLKIQQKWCLVIVYGAAQDDEKDDFLTDLGDICRDQSLPLLIGGDFNLLRGASEKNKTLLNLVGGMICLIISLILVK
jgi:hypothetical protein